MGLLGRQIVCLSKGLDEVVVSPRRHLDGEFCRQPPEQGAIQWLAGCPKTVGGVHAPEPAEVGGRAGYCEFPLCAAGTLSTATGQTQYGDLPAHGGGWLCLRADGPVEGPDRSADLLNPPGGHRRRDPLYDTAPGQICRTLKEKCFPQSSVITDYETLLWSIHQ